MSVYFGVDIGGTTVKIGLFQEDGELSEKWEIPTRKEQAGGMIPGDIVDSMKKKISELGLAMSDVSGIGVGVPGPVTEDGTVHQCPNLGWGIFNVEEKFRELTGVEKIKIGNDANVAALGEMWRGGGKGSRSIVMITLGTGVGGGVVIDGKILTGSRGAAGEIGHLCVNYHEQDTCGCGKHGCLEQYASATGIVKEAGRLLAKDKRETVLRAKELTAKHIFDAAKQGDEVAKELTEQLGAYLGMAASYLAQIVDPEVFVIGGGVSKAGQILLDVIAKKYDENVMDALKHKEFRLAELGNDAGIYGAVKLVF
jgi:glucokinase